MTEQQKYEIGFEIVSGMHASAYNQDIERGRLETKAGTELPTPEELATEGLTEIPDYCYRSVEWETKRLNDQIAFIFQVLENKLAEMGLQITPTEASKGSQEYQQRKRAIAEKMAKQDFTYMVTDFKDGLVNKYLPAAKIAVAEAAEIIKCLLSSGIVDMLATSALCYRAGIINECLIQQGLIPNNGQPFDPSKEVNTISISSQMFGGQEAGTE